MKIRLVFAYFVLTFYQTVVAIQNETPELIYASNSRFGVTRLVNKLKGKIRPILPGTKWCGDGNRSRSYDDLGRFAIVDSCCREHDMCPKAIGAGETLGDLINTGLFTRSHCECDKKFYDCLKNTNHFISREVGIAYFTVLGPQCFKNEYPIKKCQIKNGRRCVSYVLDEKGEKRLQWFDNPKF